MRTLLGETALEKLKGARIIIFGVGGVGSFAAEAAARSGIGSIDVVDNDTVCLTNLNRQLIALHSTLGRNKAEVAGERIYDINPDAVVTVHDVFLCEDTYDRFDFTKYDYVLDAIDTVPAKLYIAEECERLNVPLISSMGTGNKLDITKLRVCDIYETSGCPLARVMRRELRKRGVKQLKVVCSTEEPVNAKCPSEEESTRRSVPASAPFVPPAAGLMMVREVIRDLTGE